MKQCKECLQEKELDEFYNHPATKDKKLPRCKECIKAGRRTEKEREMARIRDRERTKTEKFKIKQKRYSEKFKREQPEKRKAQVRVSNYLRYKK